MVKFMPVLAESILANYSRMGDVCVIAVCILIFILIGTSYVSRNRSYRIFAAIVGLVFLAAVLNVGGHILINKNNPDFKYAIYIIRVVYHALLFNVFFLYILYATVVSNMPYQRARNIAVFAVILFVVFIGLDIGLTISGAGFSISDDGIVIKTSQVFTIGYVVFLVFLAVILFFIRKMVFKRVVIAFYATMLLSAAIRVGQMIINESSLTTLTFVLPTLAMLYLVHLHPYSSTIGTLDSHSLEDMVKDLYARKKTFIIMSLLLPDYASEGKTLPEVVQYQTRRFTIKYFRNGTLFQVGNGQIILIARKDSNPDYEDWMKKILNAFYDQFKIHKIPFKIVYGDSFQGKINESEYIPLIESIHNTINDNVTHRINDNDIVRFREYDYILGELNDIYRKCDLNDERVLLYCQPVLNTKTGCFDRAEALMRLHLDKLGIVSPAAFISIAEDNGYVHALTKIILNKTCQFIRKLNNRSFLFERISVNVSTVELKDENFCDDIIHILNSNGVQGQKIAIELTESQTDQDFMLAKERIELLHQNGIQFYLDDFGSGYSNMGRVLSLPFDIIKFDRTMVMASGTDARSGHIVKTLAKLFSDFNYRVLYEGIETEEDEKRCLAMSATYLQGYKYSKAIPIDQLQDFFKKDEQEN